MAATWCGHQLPVVTHPCALLVASGLYGQPLPSLLLHSGSDCVMYLCVATDPVVGVRAQHTASYVLLLSNCVSC